MKFCTKCGNEVKDEQTFCTSCGNDLKGESMNETKQEAEANSIKETQPIEEYHPQNEENVTLDNTTPNNKLSKRSKILIATVSVLIVAIIVIIQVGNSLFNPRKIATRFEQDIVTNNTSDLSKILYCNDARLDINSSNITPLLNYFKKSPSYYNEVIQNLNNDALSPKDINNINITSSNILTLTKVRKKFLIFPNYKINVKPSFVDITTTVKDVSFSINNVVIGRSETDKSTKEFGPYIPGTYSILANYKGKYTSLSKAYSVNLLEPSDGIAKLSVFEDLNYLNITSDYPDAEIFVNSKDTKTKITDATNFGPIDGDSKIYATTVINGKKLKSEEYSLDVGAPDINISFEDAINNQSNVQAQLDGVKSQLGDLLNNYAQALTQAINTNDFSLIDVYLTYGSELYKQQQLNVPGSYAEGNEESLVSASVTSFNISDDTQSGSITTTETYNFVTVNGKSSTKTYNHVYKFKYNGDISNYQFTNRI